MRSNENSVRVYGENLSSSARQNFTDGEETFRGTEAEATEHFRAKHPSKSIIVATQAKKRAIKWRR